MSIALVVLVKLVEAAAGEEVDAMVVRDVEGVERSDGTRYEDSVMVGLAMLCTPAREGGLREQVLATIGRDVGSGGDGTSAPVGWASAGTGSGVTAFTGGRDR